MKSDMRYPGLSCQPDDGGNTGVLLKPVKRFLRLQFGRPAGLWGRLAGMMMARTPSNLERILWTLSLLDLKPDDRVLEVGFGPGIAIKFLADRIPGGAIAGLDHSEVMAQQASKRNARAIQEGRVTLHVGDVSSPPVFDEPFDKIFTINSIHFWDKPVECLSKLCELMNPGGVIAVTLQPRSRGATDDTTIVIGKEVAANLIAAGFSQCRLEIRHTNPVAIACAIGIK